MARVTLGAWVFSVPVSVLSKTLDLIPTSNFLVLV
jgi:hypothetical protein